MSATYDELYKKVKPDIEELAGPLFDISAKLIQKHGSFLPQGACLNNQGKLILMNAAPDDFEERPVSTIEVLPLLHEGLRELCKKGAKAIAVSEHVNVTLEGKKPTNAIKVSIEHQIGLCVALYLLFNRKVFGGYSFGEMIAVPSNPEINLDWFAK